MSQVVVFVGQVCNNDCIMCSVSVNKKRVASYEELERRLEKNRKNFDNVSFTGGEPTEHPDIIKLFKKANQLNYEGIKISTNGRRFADPEFTKKLVDLGLGSANVAIHGTKDEHNYIIQKNGYDQAIQGLKNLHENGVYTSVDSVLMKPNIEKLPKIWQQAAEMGVKLISIVELTPYGMEKSKYEKLIIPFVDKKNFFYDNLSCFEKFELVHVTNFVRCILPVSLPRNFHYVSYYTKQNRWSFDGLAAKNTEMLKEKIEVCNKCKYSDECFGFRVKRLDAFGEENIKKMMEIDNFLKE